MVLILVVMDKGDHIQHHRTLIIEILTVATTPLVRYVTSWLDKDKCYFDVLELELN